MRAMMMATSLNLQRTDILIAGGASCFELGHFLCVFLPTLTGLDWIQSGLSLVGVDPPTMGSLQT